VFGKRVWKVFRLESKELQAFRDARVLKIKAQKLLRENHNEPIQQICCTLAAIECTAALPTRSTKAVRPVISRSAAVATKIFCLTLLVTFAAAAPGPEHNSHRRLGRAPGR